MYFTKNPTLFICVILFSLCNLYSTQILAQYTLTDDDVTVSNGSITACSYDFTITDIIIPETLDGQTITSIAHKNIGQTGVFAGKGITSVQFPSTIESIGGLSFIGNDLTSLDFSNNVNLTIIREYAFNNNEITSIDISKSLNLKTIDDEAFASNDFSTLTISHPSLERIGIGAFKNNNLLTSVNLSNSTALKVIGNDAFSGNEILTSVNLTNCTSLNSIGANCFSNGDLSSLDLSTCTEFVLLRENAFTGNESFTSLTLPTPTDPSFVEWIDQTGATVDNSSPITDLTILYSAVIPYTLTDDDVEMNGNWIYSVSYDSKYTHITIPEELDGQAVENIYNVYPGSYTNYNKIGKIGNRNIISLKLPSTMKYIGQNAFRNNPIIDLDLSECQNLGTIFGDSFYNHKLETVDLSACSELTLISEDAFYNGGTFATYDLPELSSDNFSFNHWYEDPNSETPHTGEANVRNTYKANVVWNPDVTFDVRDQDNNPVLGATVQFEGYETITTDEDGYATFDNTSPSSSYDYTVTMLNHTTVAGTVSTTGTRSFQTEDITLIPYAFGVDFTITDGTTPIANATVSLTGYDDSKTGQTGTVSFPSVDIEEDVAYTVSAEGYWTESGTLSVVDQQVEINTTLTLITYETTFTIASEGSPIANATFTLNGYGTQISNDQGIVTFDQVVPDEAISYTIEAAGYDTVQGSIAVIDAAIEQNINLTLAAYEVTFQITDGQNELANATVALQGQEAQLSDASGIVTFTGVLPTADMAYSVSAEGYQTQSGTITVLDIDLEQQIVMIESEILDVLSSKTSPVLIYPNPATETLTIENHKQQDISIFDLSGALVLNTEYSQVRQSIDISTLEKGIYFVKVGLQSSRLIIQ